MSPKHKLRSNLRKRVTLKVAVVMTEGRAEAANLFLGRELTPYQQRLRWLSPEAQLLVGVMDALGNPNLPTTMREAIQARKQQLMTHLEHSPREKASADSFLDWSAKYAPGEHWTNMFIQR